VKVKGVQLRLCARALQPIYDEATKNLSNFAAQSFFRAEIYRVSSATVNKYKTKRDRLIIAIAVLQLSYGDFSLILLNN
jgi:hypothetical protein